MMIKTRRVFGDLRVLAQLSADDVVDKMTDIDAEVQAHIKRNLAKIPHREHEAVIAEYLRIASLPREIGDNMTAKARANVWLYDRANGAKSTEYTAKIGKFGDAGSRPRLFTQTHVFKRLVT